MRAAALAIFTLCMAAAQALAGVSSTTSFKPFPVQGRSAHAIYASVMAHSRKKDGFNTFATTDVSLKPKVLLVSKPQCRIAGAEIRARFVVHLPELKQESTLPAGLRADWRSFVEGLRQHELHHRDIWLGCAKALAEAATRTPAGGCKGFARALAARIQAESKACQARNAAFDAEAEGKLPTYPFIMRALAKR